MILFHTPNHQVFFIILTPKILPHFIRIIRLRFKVLSKLLKREYHNESVFEYMVNPDQKCGDKYCEHCQSGLDYSIDKMDDYLSKQITKLISPKVKEKKRGSLEYENYIM